MQKRMPPPSRGDVRAVGSRRGEQAISVPAPQRLAKLYDVPVTSCSRPSVVPDGA